MAIDNEAKRRSAGTHLATTVYPIPDGSVDDSDRPHVAFIYSGIAISGRGITALMQSFARTPVNVVKLTVTGTIAGSQTFIFSDKEVEPLNLLFQQDIRPYLLADPDGRPARIQTDKGLTERVRITLSMADDPDAPDFDSTVFTTFKGGSFWRRLVVAQPDFRGSTVEVLRGFVASGITLDDFERVFLGVLDDIDFQRDGSVALIAKDELALKDRDVPADISDDNLLNGAIATATDSTFVVDKTAELTDPANLSSKDFWPMVIRMDPDGAGNGPEDIIINKIVGFTLTVQQNHLVRSEEFDNASWIKTGATVTANQAAGPFGGDARAELIKFGIGDTVRQDSAVVATGVTFTGSIWLRTGPAVTGSGTFTIDQLLSDGTEMFTTTVAVSDKWRRFEISTTFVAGGGQFARFQIRRQGPDVSEVQVYGAQLERDVSTRGFYAATAASAGADAGRGAFGTTAASHVDDSKFIEVVPYRQHFDPETGVHPVVILRDLVNRGQIAAASVDQDTFDDEFNFVPSLQFKRAGASLLANPRNLLEHVTEVRRQALLDLWTSESGLIRTRFSFRQNLPGVQAKSINDDDNILESQSSYRGNQESRITRAVCHFNQIAGTEGNKQEDFSNTQVTVDLAVESLSGPKIRTFFSKWIFRSAEALALTGRLVGRFKRGARLASWTLEMKDESDFDLGDVISLSSQDILSIGSEGSAVKSALPWQVIHKKPRRSEGKVLLEALEFSGRNYGIISPTLGIEDPAAAFPDFPDASAAERAFGFIGDTQNKVAGALTTAPFTLAGAAYTAATKRVVEAGAFASYTFQEGDALFAVHASAHPAFYLIDSRVDDDTIELRVAIKAVGDGATDSGDLAGLTNDTAKWRDALQEGYSIL